MMRAFLLTVALAALSACATPLPQIVVDGPFVFDVRYDETVTTVPAVDELARARCPNAEFVRGDQRYDGFSYRRYRCPTRMGRS